MGVGLELGREVSGSAVGRPVEPCVGVVGVGGFVAGAVLSCETCAAQEHVCCL